MQPNDDGTIDVNLDDIQSLRTVLGDRCRVVSELTRDEDGQAVETLTITSEDGFISSYSGYARHAWVAPPR